MNKLAAFRLDDLCATPGHTAAALAAFDFGLAKSGGVMVPTGAFDAGIAAVADLHRRRPEIDVGLHLTMQCEWANLDWRPVLPPGRVPSLVDERGRFLPLPRDNHDRGDFDADQVLAEADAQLARLRDAGIEPAYADEHMMFSWALGGDGANAVRDWCRNRGLAYAPDLDRPDSELADLRRDDGTFDAADVLASLPAGRAVMVVMHPAEVGDEERSLALPGGKPGHLIHARDGDRRLMLDPALRAAVGRGELEVLSLREMARR